MQKWKERRKWHNTKIMITKVTRGEVAKSSWEKIFNFPLQFSLASSSKKLAFFENILHVSHMLNHILLSGFGNGSSHFDIFSPSISHMLSFATNALYICSKTCSADNPAAISGLKQETIKREEESWGIGHFFIFLSLIPFFFRWAQSYFLFHLEESLSV